MSEVPFVSSPEPPEGASGRDQTQALGELVPPDDVKGGVATYEFPRAVADLMRSDPAQIGGYAVARLVLAQANELSANANDLRAKNRDHEDVARATAAQLTELKVANASLASQLRTIKGDKRFEKHIVVLGSLMFGAGFKYIEVGALAYSMMIAGGVLVLVGYLGFNAFRTS